MTKYFKRASSSAICLVALGAVASLTGTAEAKTVVCGFTGSTPVPAAAATATTPAHPAGTVNIGILYETRTEQASYKKKCNEANDKISDKIKHNAKLSQITNWVKHDRSNCGNFDGFYPPTTGTGASGNVCDNLKGGQATEVESDFFAGTIKTTFTPQ